MREKGKRESKKVSKNFVRLFDIHFLLKSNMKFIEIHIKRESIIFIFLNIKRFFFIIKNLNNYN